MSTTRNASDAYATYQREIAQLVDELAAKVSEISAQDPKGKDWTHVGDLAELKRELKAMTDRLYVRGEYAPEPGTYAAWHPGIGMMVRVTVPPSDNY